MIHPYLYNEIIKSYDLKALRQKERKFINRENIFFVERDVLLFREK